MLAGVLPLLRRDNQWYDRHRDTAAWVATTGWILKRQLSLFILVIIVTHHNTFLSV
ncbi:hypothetical protein [Aneurinibacillus tyrosinisolvens]|uniref:hypothetical protein n=1 Tax=Aneurinibacillus tyrosinisolvens TaxID=1443435 RepID=UPI001379383E|nr:hypothetical protein [Aneurinibacillus tyrosinisolvens]